MRIDDFLTRLDNVRKNFSGFTARCPNHEDKKNSLGISVAEDGKILLKCYAGCEFEDIVSKLELKSSDLMPDNEKPQKKEIIYKIDLPFGGTVEHIRIDEPGGKRFYWRRDGKTGLGGLKVRDLPFYEPPQNGNKTKQVFVTEGEKAAIAAARLGCQALGTVCGASSIPSRETLKTLAGKDVVLWADNDKAGLEHMQKIRGELGNVAKSTVIITTGGPKEDADDFKGSLEDLQRIVQKALGIRTTSLLADSMDSALHALSKFCNNDTSDRVPTGLSRIDYALRGGFMKGALYLLGAPSGDGKTTLLQNIAVFCARKRGPVLFVSPEMGERELAEREAVRVSGISINEIAPWKHPNHRLPKLVQMEEAAQIIKKEKLPIHIIDDTDITMTDIGKIAEQIEKLKLIIVDYAQEIADRDTQTARYLAVGEVGKEAITLGKRLSVPVLVASQVNVFTEGTSKNYAFRETKDLEHRAHCSMIMEIKRHKEPNRYGYFDIESARIFARKNRSGAIFSVEVDYDPALFTIKNLAKDSNIQMKMDY